MLIHISMLNKKILLIIVSILTILSLNLVSATTCSGVGGIITTDGSYCVNTITGNLTFNLTNNVNAEVLIVAGGGAGGGSNNGGGGGAGGLIYNSSWSISSGNYVVIIGQGGVGSNSAGAAKSGQNTSFNEVIATGGGGGGGGDTASTAGGNPGGSGGGAAYINMTTFGRNVINILQGKNGSVGQGLTAPYKGGGGGGAGANASTITGGNGLSYTINGSATYYAGGGSGGENAAPTAGGLGGGGNGGGNVPVTAPTSGRANSGGGGGGCQSSSTTGGSGGSGVVIIRYLGESTPTSNLTGKVKSSTGAVINGATVILLNSTKIKLANTTTNSTGDWYFNVVNGTMNMTVVGYDTSNVTAGGMAYPFINYTNRSLIITLKSTYTIPTYINVTIILGQVTTGPTACWQKTNNIVSIPNGCIYNLNNGATGI